MNKHRWQVIKSRRDFRHNVKRKLHKIKLWRRQQHKDALELKEKEMKKLQEEARQREMAKNAESLKKIAASKPKKEKKKSWIKSQREKFFGFFGRKKP